MRQKFLGLSYSFIGTICIFTLIGYFLDQLFKTNKLFITILMFLGFINAIAYFIYVVIKYAQDDSK